MGVITRPPLLPCLVLAAALAGTFASPPLLAQEPPEVIRFDIEGFVVDGGRIFSERELQSIFAPYIGPARDFGTVQRALEALEGAYRSRGYAAVQVFLPEQELSGGKVIIRAIEPQLREVVVKGNRFFGEANVHRSLPTLVPGVTPNTRLLSDAVRVANESPVKQVRVVLKPVPDEAAVDAVVEVDDQDPLRVFATADNTGTEQTGRWRLGMGVQYGNLFDRDQILTAQYVTSPTKPEQVSIYSLGYRVPLYSIGDSVDIFAGHSEVDAGQTETPAGTLEFRGSGTVAGARYNVLLARKGEYEDKLIFGLDYRIYDNVCSVGVFGSAGCGTAAANVAVHPASVAYVGRAAGIWGQTDLGISYAQNVPGGKDGSDADLQAARVGADARYEIWRANLSVARVLPADWQMRVAVAAQWSSDALIQGEQFGIGGFNTVRGFLEREVANDTGAYGTIEVYSPNLASTLGLSDVVLRALAFYDAGAVRRNVSQPGDTLTDTIASAGFGVRVAVRRNLAVRADYAYVTDAGGAQGEGDQRAHAGIVFSF